MTFLIELSDQTTTFLVQTLPEGPNLTSYLRLHDQTDGFSKNLAFHGLVALSEAVQHFSFMDNHFLQLLHTKEEPGPVNRSSQEIKTAAVSAFINTAAWWVQMQNKTVNSLGYRKSKWNRHNDKGLVY